MRGRMNHGQVDEIRWGPPTGWMRQHFAVTGEAERKRAYAARKRRWYHKRKARLPATQALSGPGGGRF